MTDCSFPCDSALTIDSVPSTETVPDDMVREAIEAEANVPVDFLSKASEFAGHLQEACDKAQYNVVSWKDENPDDPKYITEISPSEAVDAVSGYLHHLNCRIVRRFLRVDGDVREFVELDVAYYGRGRSDPAWSFRINTQQEEVRNAQPSRMFLTYNLRTVLLRIGGVQDHLDNLLRPYLEAAEAREV